MEIHRGFSHGIPDSGKPYEWFILTAHQLTAMRSSVRRLTFKKVLCSLAVLAALRPKMPAPLTDS